MHSSGTRSSGEQDATPTNVLLKTFRAQGVVHPLRVLSPDEAAGFRSRCDELEDALGGQPRTIEVRQMHLHFPWAYELATRPSILDEVEQLLGPDVVVWATELFAKHPRDQNLMIGWHRDRGYMGFAAEDVVTAWVALSDSLEENGCMLAVPGPERFSGRDLADSSAPDHRIPDESIETSRVTSVELRAGEMSLHDCLIVHGSRPNESGMKRVGFAIRYVKAGSLPLHGRPRVVLARGKLSGDHFELVRPPTSSQVDPADLKKSAVEHFDAMLINLQQAAT